MTTDLGLLAMQKVVGSSPISRFESPAIRGVSRFWVATSVFATQEEGLAREEAYAGTELWRSAWDRARQLARNAKMSECNSGYRGSRPSSSTPAKAAREPPEALDPRV
jgi:hypothetical protein